MTNSDTSTAETVGTSEWISRYFPLQFCPECGYSFAGRTGDGPCPECGVIPATDTVVAYAWRKSQSGWKHNFSNTRPRAWFYESLDYTVSLAILFLLYLILSPSLHRAASPALRRSPGHSPAIDILFPLAMTIATVVVFGPKLAYELYGFYRRRTASAKPPYPVQVRLGPDGFGDRDGFGPLRRKRSWNAPHHVEFVARQGYHRLCITRPSWIPRCLRFARLDVELPLSPKAAERLAALLAHFQANARSSVSRQSPTPH